MAVHHYNQLPIEKRREFKADMLKLKNTLLEQKEYLYNLFLKPNDDKIKAIDKVLKNEITIEQFRYTLGKIEEYKKKVFEMIKFE